MSTDPSLSSISGDQRPTSNVQRARKRNMQLGLSLFALYSALYAAFVFANAFFPAAMEARPWGGLNVALLTGFGLIGAAILLAFIYGVFSRTGTEGGSDDL